jgi:ATP/maltotriose-dependent transcriptional regulator MalT
MEEELGLLNDLDAVYDSGFTLTALSGVNFGKGNVKRARALATEAAGIFRRFGEQRYLAATDWYLGLFDAADRRFPRAARKYRDALLGAWETGDQMLACKAMNGLAAMAVEGGKADTAARWLGAVDHQLALIGGKLFPFDVPAYQKADSYGRSMLGEHDFSANHQAGGLLSRLDLRALADGTVQDVEDAARAPRPRGAVRTAGMTAREREVLVLIAEGKTDREIAQELFISLRTVNAHVASILAHLEVSSRREAVSRGRELGMLIEGSSNAQRVPL